jgi:hypothetical protein
VSQTVSPAPADRLAFIIEGLCHAVARRVGPGGLAGPFLILIWARLRRIAARFARYAANPPLPSRPRAPLRAAPRPARPSLPRPLPRRSAWLLRLVPETASGAAQLRHFLADPEVTALLATAPRLGRALRPLCHMLGIRATGIGPAQALPPPGPPPPSQPPGTPPAPLIPRHAPPVPAASQAAPIALPHWPTPPPGPALRIPA